MLCHGMQSSNKLVPQLCIIAEFCYDTDGPCSLPSLYFAQPEKGIINTVNMQLVRETLSVQLVKERANGGLHLSDVLPLE